MNAAAPAIPALLAVCLTLAVSSSTAGGDPDVSPEPQSVEEIFARTQKLKYPQLVEALESALAGITETAARGELSMALMLAHADYMHLHDLQAPAYTSISSKLRSIAEDILATQPATSIQTTTARLQLRALERARGWSLADVKGNKVDGTADALANYRNKVVLLDFWATWCGACIAGHPDLAVLKREMADRPFEIIGISVDDTRETAARYVAQHDMPWVQWNIGSRSALVEELAIFGYPTYFLVDGSGTVQRRLSALPETFKQELRKLVAEQERGPTAENP